MKKLLILLLLTVPMLVMGKVSQPGEVRAISYKYGVKGEPIEGVRVKAGLTEARSGADGRFTVPVPRSKDNVFKFNSIVKAGYTAVSPSEQELRAKNYAVNAKSSVIVVMADPQTLSREKAAIEKKIWKSKEKQIAEREHKIEAQRAEIERLQTANKEVAALMAKVEKMEEELQAYKREFYSSGDRIAKEAERLAQIDYQTLDAEQARITDLLKGGKGDEVVRLSKEQITEELLSEITQDPGAMKREIEKRQALLNTTAQRLKNLAGGYAVEYKNDSAAYYLKLRADMNADNFDWQMEYGRYIHYYFAKFEEALEVYNRCLDIAKKGDNKERMAMCYNNIGGIYDNRGEYAKALEYYMQALSILKTIYVELHPYVASSYNNIGLIYYRQGNYAKALEYYDKSLSITKSLYGETLPDVAMSYNNMGMVYAGQRNYAKALECYGVAVAILKNVYGEIHSSIGVCYDNIGMVYSNLGNYEKALEYQEQALSIGKKIYGEIHPIIAHHYHNIGFQYLNQKKYAESLEYFKKALSIMKASYGDIHPDIAANYINIGMLYLYQGDNDKAMEYFEQALSIMKTVYGDTHIAVADCYINIGMIYIVQRDFAKALECYEKALLIKEAIYGTINPDVAKCYINVGIVYYNQNDYAKSLEYYKKSREIYTRLGENFSSVIETIDTVILDIESKMK